MHGLHAEEVGLDRGLVGLAGDELERTREGRGDDERLGLEEADGGIGGVEGVEDDAAGGPALGKVACSSLMNRRFIGKATSTPRTDRPIMNQIMCHIEMMRFSTIMYAASPEMSGPVM